MTLKLLMFLIICSKVIASNDSDQPIGEHCVLRTITGTPWTLYEVINVTSESIQFNQQISTITTTSSGTGFLVKLDNHPGVFCLTAAHCVAGSNNRQVCVNLGGDVPCKVELYCIRTLPSYKPMTTTVGDADIRQDFSSIFLNQQNFPNAYTQPHLTLASKVDQKLLAGNLDRIIFGVPVTFCGSEYFMCDTYTTEPKKPNSGQSIMFVFPGTKCKILSDGMIKTPPCTVRGNSGSPLVVLKAAGDHLQNLVGKAFGLCSYGVVENTPEVLNSQAKTYLNYSAAFLATGYVVWHYARNIETSVSKLRSNYPLFSSLANGLRLTQTLMEYGKRIMLVGPVTALAGLIINSVDIIAYYSGRSTRQIRSCFQLIDCETLSEQFLIG